MSTFELISVLVLASALLSYVNFKLVKLPQAIGLMVLSLGLSILLIPLDHIFPHLLATVKARVALFEFSNTLLNIMLCFFLFSAAYHANVADLRKEKGTIAIFASAGVVLCTLATGTLLYLVLTLFDFRVGLLSCLLFGALISPTDPIAVLGILAKSRVPVRIKTNIIGESLFNDGIGVVVFISVLHMTQSASGHGGVLEFFELFLIEALGGLLFGLVLGYLVYILLKSIDHYQTELLITLAAVMAGYAGARHLHVSGPLAMVVAGLFTSAKARENAMSTATVEYVDKFWKTIDELLNAFLFVLIGIEVILISVRRDFWFLSAVAIVVVLLSRFLSVLVPYLATKKWSGLPRETPVLMTWGGLRGGLSIAMALTIQRSLPEKDLWIFATYMLVIFSLAVQAISLKYVLRHYYGNADLTPRNRSTS
jgi:CPA1 family monovalent cation:H+ antiporter